MKLLRAADRVAVAWRNGGGVTREVARFAAGADGTDFEWRVSIADVTARGPFSRFEGIDRVLMVLDGRLALRFDDTDEMVELAPGRPFAFPGDAAVSGTPIGGPVRDLNVMVRRDLWRGTIRPGDPGLPIGGIRIAVARMGDPGIALLDALLLDADEPFPACLDGWQVRLDAGRSP